MNLPPPSLRLNRSGAWLPLQTFPEPQTQNPRNSEYQPLGKHDGAALKQFSAVIYRRTFISLTLQVAIRPLRYWTS